MDDELAGVDLKHYILEFLGYCVVSENCSPDALKTFEQSPHRFDILITDMTMPQMNGVDLPKEIKAIRQELPVIICSGLSEQMS